MNTAKLVLLVEDDDDVAESMTALLSLRGYPSTCAAAAHLALEHAKRFNPDVVLLDIGLPDMDGYALASALREQTGGADRLLVGLSGHGQDGLSRREILAGLDAYFVKPVDVEALAVLIDRFRASRQTTERPTPDY